MLKRLFLVVIAFVGQATVCPASPKTINLLHDLDGLLMDYLPPENKLAGFYPMQPDFQFEGRDFRFRKGAGEYLLSLANIPNVQIGVFSAGSAERNYLALKSLILPNGKSALNLTTGRVFSRDQVVATSNYTAKQLYDSWGEWPQVVPSAQSRIPGFGGSNEAKKVLTRVLPDAWLSKTLLIDDTPKIVAGGEEKNWVNGGDHFMLLHIQRKFYNSPGLIAPRPQQALLRDIETAKNPALVSNILFENLQANDFKLVRLRGMLEQAMRNSQSDRVSLRESIWRVQADLKRLHETEGPSAVDAKNFEFFRLGFQKFREVNPKFENTSVCGTALGG